MSVRMSGMNGYLILGIAIALEIAGTTALRGSEGFTRLWPSAVVLVTYSGAFFFLARALLTIPMGVAYAIWSGIGTTAITLIGLFVFRQKLDLPAALGIAMVIAGVLVINLFSRGGAQ